LRKRDTAIVGYKTCPHCGGTGIIPCTGREYYQKLHKEWADSLHGKMVTVPFLVQHEVWGRVPGLAIKKLTRGGWWAIRVYVSIDKGLNWGSFNMTRYGYDEDHDLINDRRLYYIEKGYPDRQDVELLSMTDLPEELKEVALLAKVER